MRIYKAVVALDQSTSATKAVLMDNEGRILGEATRSHPSSFPRAGWVEQDPETLWDNTRQTLEQMAHEAEYRGVHLCGLGVTNQRETVIVWDRRTGRPVHPAVGWQCLRGQGLTDAWKAEGLADRVKSSTGLPLDPHFSASKIAWILHNVPGAQQAAMNGELVFGTIDSWLLFHLTSGKVHATDPSNASRTLLFNLQTGRWDAELFQAFGIPQTMAPEIRMSDSTFGMARIGKSEVPICGVLGDSHAALFGHRCFETGKAKATYGTGSSIMMNLGTALPSPLPDSVATSVAWGIDGVTSYVLEGNIHHSGDTLRWLAEDLGLFENPTDLQERAARTASSEGVYLVPAFSGLGAPHWDEHARGAIVGLVRGTTKDHIAKAAMDSLAFQVADLIDAMRGISGTPIEELAVDGGPTKNGGLMQFQSDIAEVVVRASEISNASIYGIGCLAGLSSGVWTSLEELLALRKGETLYKSKMDAQTRKRLWDGWKTAVAQTRVHPSDARQQP